MTMAMSFSAGSKVTILFDGWETQNAGQLFGSVIAIILLGIFYEVLKFWRETLASNALLREQNRIVHAGSGNGGNGSNGNGGGGSVGGTAAPAFQDRRRLKEAFFSRHHLLQTAMHLIQVTIGYFLMLIAMTYNVWCFLAVILGSGIGYFLVGWRRCLITEYSDHC